MDTKQLVQEWISKWEQGDFMNLPLTDNFKHTSPFGTIAGKKEYLDLVKTNKDKFLGYRFEIHDELYEKDRACIRYTGHQDDYRLEVSEWYYTKGDKIEEIIAHFNVAAEIPEERKLEEG